MHSSSISSIEQARKMAEKYYQRSAHGICTVSKEGNTATVNILFGALDNEYGIYDVLCMCRGDPQLVYTALKAKPVIFAHINNADLVKELDE